MNFINTIFIWKSGNSFHMSIPAIISYLLSILWLMCLNIDISCIFNWFKQTTNSWVVIFLVANILCCYNCSSRSLATVLAYSLNFLFDSVFDCFNITWNRSEKGYFIKICELPLNYTLYKSRTAEYWVFSKLLCMNS